MAKTCPDKITADELTKMNSYWSTVNSYLIWLQVAVVIVCAIILFGCYRRLKKPTFVWVIWGLFIVSEVAYFTEGILNMPLERALESGDIDKYYRLARFHNEAYTVYVITLMSGHWVFGIKYAEVVLKLPVLVFHENVRDIRRKLKRISCAVWLLNGFFVALIFSYSLLMQLYLFGVCQNEVAVTWLNRLNLALYLSPTVLLLVAVIKVRCMVSQLRNKAILQKEKIILLHTVLFSLYFTAFTI